MAGDNYIFDGDKLLKNANPGFEEDNAMFALLGLTPMEAFKQEAETGNSKIKTGEVFK